MRISLQALFVVAGLAAAANAAMVPRSPGCAAAVGDFDTPPEVEGAGTSPTDVRREVNGCFF